MRTLGDWVLAALGILTLLVLAVFLWWFGPWHAALGFGVWALLSAPLLMLAYRRTRSRWLLYFGSGLIPCGLVFGTTADEVWLWGTWPAAAANAFAAGLPLVITVAWVSRLLRSSHGPQERWTILHGGALVASVGVMLGTLMSARADERRPEENATFTQSFAGCYEIEVGPWIPSMMLGHAAQGIIPARLQLDSARRVTYVAHNSLAIRPRWAYGDAWWLPIDANQVRLVWHNGFNGVSVNLHRRGAQLRGKAIGSTDVGGFWPESRALVRARPTDCRLVLVDSVIAKGAASAVPSRLKASQPSPAP